MSNLLLQKYLETKGFVEHNIESFNKFVGMTLQKIIDEAKPISPDITPKGVKNVKIKLGKLWLEEPSIKEADGTRRPIIPMEARLRHITYESPIMAEMSLFEDDKEVEKETVTLGSLPIMLKSSNCFLNKKTQKELIELGEDISDPGGYFIINGTERVVVIIEDLAPNKILVEKVKTGPHTHQARIYSEQGQYKVPHIIEKGKDGMVYVTFTRVTRIPFVVLMNALGVLRNKQISQMVSEKPQFQTDLYINLYEASTIKKEDEALELIGKKIGIIQSDELKIQRAKEVIDQYLFPHIGSDVEDRVNKAKFLAKVVKKLLRVSYKELPEDDKDHYSNKRLRLCGDMLENLFRYAFKMIIGDIKYNYERATKRGRSPSIHSIIRSQLLTSRIRSALATGQWVGNRQGVSQHLDRLNQYSTISHLRRVASLLTASRENFEARDLHPTHWGKLCTSETPEGPNIGLRKNLALTCEVSTEPKENDESIIKELEKFGLEKEGQAHDVYLNNKLVGSIEKPEKFVSQIIKTRREGKLIPELNITHDVRDENVYVYTEKGRARRPIIIVENGQSKLTKELFSQLKKGKLTFTDLIKKSIIEYLDVDEEENSFIAMNESDINEETTHLEMSPLVIVGSQTAMIPYLEHNPTTRTLIGAKTLKQSLGIYSTNFLIRSDTDKSILHYPQKPIVGTAIHKAIGFDSHPVGQNIIVVIMPFEGYNMDDAIVINKSSIDRGLFRATYFTPFRTEEIKYPGGQVDQIEIPDKDIKGYRTEEQYSYLSDDGIIYPEAKVDAGDVVIGKTSPPRFLTSLEEFKIGVESRTETSISIPHGTGGVVESVIITESEEGNRLIDVKLRDQRIPEIGDKFSSRFGQKGVIGMLAPQEDLPFTKDGVVPDIIFSPHSIPSRMTISHLIELLAGKVGSLAGRYIDGTGFNNEDEFSLRKELKKLGFRENGSETMYDGRTGKMYKAKIFVGNMYYLRLKHMVANKIHARSRGPVQLLTRQPTEGRSKEGGLRLGEMEKDCFVAHGASLALKERFSSDNALIPICKNCGLTAVYNKYRKKGACPVCGEDAPITLVEISYAFKLLLDELKSLCIYPKLYLKPKS